MTVAPGECCADHARRGRVMHHHRARAFRDALQHGVLKVAPVEARTGAGAPHLFGQGALPFSVVVDELIDVGGAAERAEEEMMQHGVVQHHHAGLGERAAIDLAVQWIVAQVIERDVGVARVRLHAAVAAQGREQRRGVVGHAGSGGRQRRVVCDFHGLRRFPNSAVPTRTMVAPSSMAASRSCDMPMESCGSPCRPASSCRRWK
jgi:hypothetical protein